MKNQTFAGIVGMMALLAGGSAFAGEEMGFYAGGSVGLSLYEDEEDDIAASMAAAGFSGSIDTDNTDLGWKLYGGFRFNPYFGTEIGYIDLGEQSVDVSLSSPLVGNVNATAEVNGVSLTGTAGYPILPQAYVFGKLGGYVWDSNVDGGLSVGATPVVSLGDDDNGVDLTFGIGGTWELVEHVKVRAEWERFQGLGDEDTDVDLFSGGIQYDF